MKNEKNNYWETEKGELIEFGKCFMRCFDKAGKLQFGSIYIKKDGEKLYFVKFTLDRNELYDSREGVDFLKGLLDVWQEIYDKEN